MNKIIIKTEYLPNRCEICHQSDLYNSQNDKCLRCLGLELPITKEDYEQTTNSTRIRINRISDPFVKWAGSVFLINIVCLLVAILNVSVAKYIVLGFLGEFGVIFLLSFIASFNLRMFTKRMFEGYVCGLGFSILFVFLLCSLLDLFKKIGVNLF